MNLGERMKRYEFVTRNYLTCKTPVIVRIDGKAFHTFTKGLEKPYDKQLMRLMQDTTLKLCKEVDGCKIGYTQSDEISLLITDWENVDTQAWFQNNLSKIISVTASIATLEFNKNLLLLALCGKDTIWGEKTMKALFDSRAFNLPKEEVCNYFIWRQQDATRNAIQLVGQSNFSHNQLQGKTCNQIQEMLFQEKEINFNDFPATFKRGTCVIKENGKWIIDKEIPIFTQEREYIERFL